VLEWIEGDPAFPPPPLSRRKGRNSAWLHLYNRDVISMPDNWEFPWYASWDLAFHMVALAEIDPHYAKEQLVCCCANGTCTRTGRYRRTSLRLET